MKYTKHIAVILFLQLFTNGIGAQVMGTKVFTIAGNGTSPKIYSLIKHSAGYLLVGAANGLYRFDGNNFVRYQLKDTLANKAITAIAEDHSHKVWVGFQSGEIGRVVNGAVTLLKAEEGHPKVSINFIVEDSNHVMFFATSGEGIYYYNHDRFYNINTDDGLSDNYVYDLQLAPGNKIIAGTDQGLNVCSVVNNKKNVTSYTSKNGIPDNIVRTTAPFDDHTFLLGMQDKGVGLFDVASQLFRSFSNVASWAFGQVNSLYKSFSELWAGTDENGIIKVTKANATPLKFDNNYTFTKANHLLPDDEGNIWFTSNNQLVKTSGIQIQNIVPSTAPLYEQIHTILSDKNGNIWINYNHGLKELTQQNEQWIIKDHRLQAIDATTDVTCLYEDAFGNIWIGTMGKGIIILDPLTGKSRSVIEDDLLNNGSILSINGRNNKVWISSLAGTASCNLSPANSIISNPYAFKNFVNVKGIGSNYVYDILVDSKDRVWFGTDGRGISVEDHGKFTNYSEANGLKSKVIYSLCEDTKGNIWFSTLNAGIYKFDGKTFTNYSVEQGLSDATITALAVDKKGNVAGVSKKGINIIEAATNNICYMNGDQGIQELNEDLNCITTSIDGGLVLSSSSGLIKYMPTYTSLQPRIMLDNVQLFLKDIDTLTQKDFAYDENNLTFTFSGISFSHVSSIQYQYRLKGLSNEWVSTKDSKINFPKLPSGKYTFEVRTAINSSFNNSSIASYNFTIARPFWFQWWFISAAFIVVSALLYWYIKIREKRLKRIDRLEKDRIQSQFETLKSQVNPHFLFNSFNTLIGVIEENPERAVEYVEHLSDLYRKIVTYRDKDVITLKEEMDLINDYFFIQKKRFGNNLILQNQLTANDLVQYMIAPLTLQLLAENAVKHNGISSVAPLVIELYIEAKCLVIKNNLNPKLTVEKGAGMGLQNIQNRYKLLSTDIVSIEKSDSHFCVKIPLLKTTA